MRVWFDSEDIAIDVEDWQEAEFHHAAWMDAPTDILTGATIQLDLTMDEARPEFSSGRRLSGEIEGRKAQG